MNKKIWFLNCFLKNTQNKNKKYIFEQKNI